MHAAAKLWLQLVSFLSLFTFVVLTLIVLSKNGLTSPRSMQTLKLFFLLPLPGLWIVLLPPGIHLAWRWMYFVRIAEDVFRTFGWKDVERIDLRKSSKGSKGPDVFGYGYLYYRY